MKTVKQFISLVKEAEKIIDSPIGWDTRYHLIFSEELSGEIKKTGIKFDWCDPDTSYQDDVMAYFWAIKDKAEELGKIV